MNSIQHPSDDLSGSEKIDFYLNQKLPYSQDKEIDAFNNSIDKLVDTLIQVESGLDALNIPDWQKSKISYLAYEKGHAYGHHEIYSHLLDLVDLFKEN